MLVDADVAQWLVRRLPKPDTRVRFPPSAFFMSPGPGLNGIDLPVAFDSLMLIINIDNSFELPF